jgi:hypothetical protein
MRKVDQKPKLIESSPGCRAFRQRRSEKITGEFYQWQTVEQQIEQFS